MTYTIIATAPTVYQLSSLKAFGMGANKHGNGSFSASQEFDSEDEAKQYLRKRAEMYNSNDPYGTEERLADMYRDIEYGVLTLDAATAHIEEKENE